MKSIGFLYTAYVATWLIHLGYVAYLVTRAKRLREDMRDLERETPEH
jgi:CcmD family protein